MALDLVRVCPAVNSDSPSPDAAPPSIVIAPVDETLPDCLNFKTCADCAMVDPPPPPPASPPSSPSSLFVLSSPVLIIFSFLLS